MKLIFVALVLVVGVAYSIPIEEIVPEQNDEILVENIEAVDESETELERTKRHGIKRINLCEVFFL